MRWHQLFSDLDAQAAAEESADLSAEVADRARFEAGQVTLIERMRGQVGRSTSIALSGGRVVQGTVSSVGADWLLLRQGVRDILVADRAVEWVRFDPASTVGTAADLEGLSVRRLKISVALRCLARDRSVVGIDLVDGSALTGTIDRVGADHVELAEHPVEEPRRLGAVRHQRLVGLAAVASMTSQGQWATS